MVFFPMLRMAASRAFEWIGMFQKARLVLRYEMYVSECSVTGAEGLWVESSLLKSRIPPRWELSKPYLDNPTMHLNSC